MSLELLDVRFSAVVRRVSSVLVEDSKLAFAELFALALGGATAPSGVERRSFGPSPQGSRSAVGLGLGIGLGLLEELIAEFLTEVSLRGIFQLKRKASSAVMRSHSAVEGQKFVMSFC